MSVNLEKSIGYTFKNKDLLTEALTHPSKEAKAEGAPLNYQRLEFLGDSVLGLVISEMLFNNQAKEKEGALAKRRAGLICTEMLSKIANEIGIGSYLILASSEENSGGRSKPTNLENSLEAIIGAIYIDSGLDSAKVFIDKFWGSRLSLNIEPPKDAKSQLQEWAQKQKKPIPIYNIVESTGPAHSPDFTIELSVQGFQPMIAKGNSRKKAEQLAAQQFIKEIVK